MDTIKDEIIKDKLAFYAPTRKEWREWLIANGETEKSVLLIIYHKKSKTPGIKYEEAVEEALCFGWIDSRANSRDSESYYQNFTPRNPKSKWSKSNRERVERLIEEGKMTHNGQRLIDIAKQTGKWEG